MLTCFVWMWLNTGNRKSHSTVQCQWSCVLYSAFNQERITENSYYGNWLFHLLILCYFCWLAMLVYRWSSLVAWNCFVCLTFYILVTRGWHCTILWSEFFINCSLFCSLFFYIQYSSDVCVTTILHAFLHEIVKIQNQNHYNQVSPVQKHSVLSLAVLWILSFSGL